MLNKKCPNCGVDFKTYPSINKLCCTPNCAFELKKKNSYNKYKKICESCGDEFLPPRQKDGGRFCSRDCFGLSVRAERVDRSGYWHVIAKDHPRATSQGYVAEHTLIIEAEIGRFLTVSEVVHHKDEDRKNNDISNLQLMTDSEHKRHHMVKQRNAGKMR